MPTLTRQILLAFAALAVVSLIALALLSLPLPPRLHNTILIAVTVGLPIAGASALLWRALTRRGVARGPVATITEHTLGAVLFSAVLTAAIVAVALAVDPESAREFVRSGDAMWQFVYGFVIYGAVAAGARAARTQARLKERELAAARAELQALRARLEPHFLFNTLHSLTQLAREDARATEDALERFGNLMRYVLNAGREPAAQVSVEEELAFVRDYVVIEKLRLGERLRIVESTDPDALELAIPPLLLQPLVENAIRHGLEPRRNGGTIRLDARVCGEALEITVADDGNGAAPSAWETSGGLGLKSVRRQLAARYGGDGELVVATRHGQGFTAMLRLPACLPAADAP